MGEFSSRPGGPVLVAVGDAAHAQQLVRTASDLAREGSGTVRLVSVVVKPHGSPFGVFDDETIRREYAGDRRELIEAASPPPGVSVEREVVVARSVAGGIRTAVEETDPAALVVGWEGGAQRSDFVLGTTVDRLVERTPCDLYVERIGREADGVDSILLPVAGGPHVPTAAAVASAIADANDAQVTVCSAVTADEGLDAAGTAVTEGRAAVDDAPGRPRAIETAILEGSSVTDAIVAESAAHDVLVFGVTRQGSLRRQLVGSVPRRVVDRTDETVIFARNGSVVGGTLDKLGQLVGW